MIKESFQLSTNPVKANALHLELNFQQRQKSRSKAETLCGQTIGWFLERGRVLQQGDVMLCEDGTEVLVNAADETVSEVHCEDLHLLTRAAYHLGNRHVPLQIGEGWLRYQHDHVLDEMLEGLGLTVACCEKPFHPEDGAYVKGSGKGGGHGHHHHGHNEGESE